MFLYWSLPQNFHCVFLHAGLEPEHFFWDLPLFSCLLFLWLYLVESFFNLLLTIFGDCYNIKDFPRFCSNRKTYFKIGCKSLVTLCTYCQMIQLCWELNAQTNCFLSIIFLEFRFSFSQVKVHNINWALRMALCSCKFESETDCGRFMMWQIVDRPSWPKSVSLIAYAALLLLRETPLVFWLVARYTRCLQYEHRGIFLDCPQWETMRKMYISFMAYFSSPKSAMTLPPGCGRM